MARAFGYINASATIASAVFSALSLSSIIFRAGNLSNSDWTQSFGLAEQVITYWRSLTGWLSMNSHSELANLVADVNWLLISLVGIRLLTYTISKILHVSDAPTGMTYYWSWMRGEDIRSKAIKRNEMIKSFLLSDGIKLGALLVSYGCIRLAPYVAGEWMDDSFAFGLFTGINVTIGTIAASTLVTDRAWRGYVLTTLGLTAAMFALGLLA